jgi:Phage protein Gp138 N-terminal domain
MDPRERIESLDTAILTAIKGDRTELWTALPAFVVSYDAAKQTISAQPTILLQASDQYNNTFSVKMPIIPDIPVCFPNGGGFSLTFPIKASSDPSQADECLLIFASRCIDGWFAYSGTQNQVEPRMHDLSDGFAIIGPRSLPKTQAVAVPDTSGVQLRKDDGTSYVQIDATGDIELHTSQPGINVSIKANGAGAQIQLQSEGPTTITSATSITLTAPPSTIIANGNVLG